LAGRLEQAIREIVPTSTSARRREDREADKECPLVFYGVNASRSAAAAQEVRSAGQFSYCITDEESRVNMKRPPTA